MKVGDLIKVNTRNPTNGVHRWQLGVIIAFASDQRLLAAEAYIALTDGSKVWLETKRLEAVNESR